VYLPKSHREFCVLNYFEEIKQKTKITQASEIEQVGIMAKEIVYQSKKF